MGWECVASDNISGSEELALQFLDGLEALLKHPVDYRAELANAASIILSAKPRMAVFYNLFNYLFLAGRERAFLLEAVKDYRQSLLDSRYLLYLEARELLRTDHLLLHSYSSTIVSVLEAAMQEGIRPRVTVTESRPVMEGHRTASRLAGLGFEVTIITDAAAATQLTPETVVLLGADCITVDAVENKVGSYMIALAGREKGSKVYALATSSKLLPARIRLPKEPMKDPSEVWAERPTNVRVWNCYFEAIPLPLFCGVILESGVTAPAEVSEMLKCRKWATEMNRYLLGGDS